MRAKVVYLPLLLFLLICLESSGQVPGYLGKKFVVKYFSELDLLTVGPSINGKGAYTFDREYDLWQNVGFSYNGSVGIEYALKRRRSLCASAGFYRADVPVPIAEGDFDYLNIEDAYETLERLQVIHFSARYKFFNRKKGSLAPLGKFFAIGLHHSIIKGTLEGMKLNDEILDEEDYVPLEFDRNSFLTSAVFEFGKSFIYSDRFYLSASSQFTFPIFPRSFYSEIRTGENITSNNFDENAQLRIFNHQIFSLRIGLGILL